MTEIRSYVLNGRHVYNPDVKDLMDAYRELSAWLNPIRSAAWEQATKEWLTRGDLYWLKEQGEDPLTYNPFRGEPEGLES